MCIFAHLHKLYYTMLKTEFDGLKASKSKWHPQAEKV